MTDDNHLDNELANLTDRMLAGEDVSVSPELAELSDVVRNLRDAIQKPPAPQFQAQLAQRLDQEWTVRQPQRGRSRLFFRPNRVTQVAALAASVVVVLFVVALVVSEQQADKPLSGTATGPVAGVAVIAAAIIGLILLIGFWTQRK